VILKFEKESFKRPEDAYASFWIKGFVTGSIVGAIFGSIGWWLGSIN